jgi:hypothetical protein
VKRPATSTQPCTRQRVNERSLADYALRPGTNPMSIAGMIARCCWAQHGCHVLAWRRGYCLGQPRVERGNGNTEMRCITSYTLRVTTPQNCVRRALLHGMAERPPSRSGPPYLFSASGVGVKPTPAGWPATSSTPKACEPAAVALKLVARVSVQRTLSHHSNSHQQ